MSNIKLSIIIPVYNVEKYIDACLQSIVEQEPQNIEVILINDGSTDNSRIICEKYCEKYEYMTLHNQKNQGLSAARNQGIVLAKGRYLYFLDSDDYLIKGVLKDLEMVLPDTDKDFIIGKHDMYLERIPKYIVSGTDYEKLQGSDNPLEIFEQLSQKDPFWYTASILIIKREFLIKNKLYFKREVFHEDELWVPLVFFYAEAVKLFNKSLFCYRIGRSDSVMKTPNIKKEFDKIIIIDEFDKMIKNTKADAMKIKLLKDRRAVLEWTLIQDVQFYESDPRVSELKKQLKKRIKYLKHRKYVLGFFLCSVLGIDNVRKLNRLRVRLRGIFKFKIR